MIHALYNFLLSSQEKIPVEQDPEIALEQWSVIEASFLHAQNSRHLIGCRTGSISCPGWRVSTEIMEFVPQHKAIVTRSGRIYTLSGQSFHNDDSEIWHKWQALFHVLSYADVTSEYEQKMKNTILKGDR